MLFIMWLCLSVGKLVNIKICSAVIWHWQHVPLLLGSPVDAGSSTFAAVYPLLQPNFLSCCGKTASYTDTKISGNVVKIIWSLDIHLSLLVQEVQLLWGNVVTFLCEYWKRFELNNSRNYYTVKLPVVPIRQAVPSLMGEIISRSLWLVSSTYWTPYVPEPFALIALPYLKCRIWIQGTRLGFEATWSAGHESAYL